MEFDLIDRIRTRARNRADVVLGIGDDAALLQVPAGQQLAVSTDTLNIGVHFDPEVEPLDLGWKALAVNLSDLAAMGARPAWCTLALSLPRAEAGWLDGFIDGFLGLAAQYRVALVGGDITRGPLSIGVTAIGLVEPGHALRRDRARVGDDIWVTGVLGDAAAALALRQAGDAVDAALRRRLERPTPRVSIGLALCGIAHACIDVSDGLWQDLGHVCAASGVGADIDVDALPASSALRAYVSASDRRVMQACGGDDYELCFTAPVGVRREVQRLGRDWPVARIGRISARTGVRAKDRAGAPWRPPRAGYAHFA